MEERLRRWRLLLGTPASGLGTLPQQDQTMDETLAALYDAERTGRLGPSQPNLRKWLGDIQNLFPKSIEVLQRDAIAHLGVAKILEAPELARSIQPDPRLAATLVRLSQHLPEKSREAAQKIVRQIVDQITQRIRLHSAQKLKLRRSSERRKRGSGLLDFDQTIRANLKHAQPEGGIMVEVTIVHPRAGQSLKHMVIAMDQSGSMDSSLVYSGVFASVLASLPALHVRAYAFSTDIIDLTNYLDDPVEMLFAARLGGGTDIGQAMAYARQIIDHPSDTVFVLISDLFDGGDSSEMLKHAYGLVNSGVRMLCLLALDDEGEPAYDHHVAQELAAMDVPCVACTPDTFPDVLARAIS